MENGLPVEHFNELVLLRKADISTIYETLTDCMKKKGLVIGNVIGMGFDGAATFSGRYNGVQALRIHLTQFFCTATAISWNWLVFKLQTILKVSNMFTQH